MPDSTTNSDSLKNDIINSIQDSVPVDTSKLQDSLLLDSIITIDSTLIDSTARLKYFKHKLKDKPYIEFNETRRPKLFLESKRHKPRRSYKIDSTGINVIISETANNFEPREALVIPFDLYIKLRLQALKNKELHRLARDYKLRSSNTELAQFLKDITNIEIPLPSSGIFSIFGKPQIKIKINGAVNIHGAWKSETIEGQSLSGIDQTQGQPDLKQQIQVSVNGLIGDKLSIKADWNTERTFEYENQLKLVYTGYEDEIIQSIEAGNVSLQTSALVGGSEALFGIKTKFKFGPLTLTALASQKKGETEEANITSGSTSQDFEIRAYDYSTNHFFVNEIYADTSADKNIFYNYYGGPAPITTQVVRENYIKQIEVWKSSSSRKDKDEYRVVNAFIDLAGINAGQEYGVQEQDLTQPTINGENLIGYRFIQLVDGTDYTYNDYAGFISIKTNVQENEAIAVAYRIEGPTQSQDDDIYFGEFINNSSKDDTTLVLKLVKPPQLQPDFKKAWKLQLKNIYPISGRDINPEGFELGIKYEIDGSEPSADLDGINYVTIFGLDINNTSGELKPDGVFDFTRGRKILPATGEIIFPKLQPFGKNLPGNLDTATAYQAIYEETQVIARRDKLKDKYIIYGKYSGGATSVYNIGFNVVENSVKVYSGERLLKAGVDYIADYNLGQVNIINDNELAPGRNIRITYEKNDLFQLASKTLLGLRAVYDFNRETKLGFSYLNLNQETLSDKVRIGEEPLNNSIFGADFQSNINLPFVTKALDKIFSTKAKSSINLRGELAYIDPNPNTKTSNITTDNSQSIAFLDDFEGAKKIIPIGIQSTGWKDISIPDSIPMFDNSLSTSQKMSKKARSSWITQFQSSVQVTDIWPDRQTARADRNVTLMEFVYDPSIRGPYNGNPNLTDRATNWGGFMTGLSSTANNLAEENIEFIEFWVNIIEAPPNAVLNVDLGQISEDIFPNHALDTEDKDDNGQLNGPDEDLGLDGMNDAEERQFYGSTLADPAGDNHIFSSTDFTYINGTEGNINYRQGFSSTISFDTEDLNSNFTLDNTNSYFRYKIPLDTNRANNPYITGGGSNGWYQIRIPIREYDNIIGNPTLNYVESLRLWLSGADSKVYLRFVEMNFLGNQWKKVLVEGKVTEDDEVLSISTASVEENPEYKLASQKRYIRERDRSNPDEQILKNEQALELSLLNLVDGDNREVFKDLLRPLDLFNYRFMKFDVFTNDTLDGQIGYYRNPTNYGTELYFRFGSDTLNFYEYRMPLRKNPESGFYNWNEIKIDFSELTAIKERRVDENELFYVDVPDKSGHKYGVRGNPTLTRIKLFLYGIVNPVQSDSSTFGSVSGKLWINEMRVVGVDDTEGLAYSASAAIALADILRTNFTISKTDPFFHRLSERFGSRVDNKRWGATADLDILKILPFNLNGSNLRINYSHNENFSRPLYQPGTDKEVDKAAEQLKLKMIETGSTQAEAEAAAQRLKTNVQTVSISNSISVPNIKFQIPTDKWYLRDLVNGLSFGFNYNKTVSRDVRTLFRKRWVWNVSANYTLTFSRENYFRFANIPLIGDFFKIFTDYKDARFNFSPKLFATQLTASRTRNTSLSRSKNSKTIINKDMLAQRGFNFSWKFTEGAFFNWDLVYRVNVKSSLAHLLDKESGFERRGGEIWKAILSGPIFGKDINYDQTFDLKTSPRLPTFWNINKYLRISAGYTVTYRWTNNLSQPLLGRAAGYSKRISTNMSLRLKSIFDPLFKTEPNIPKRTVRKPTRRGRTNRTVGEETSDEEKKTSEEGDNPEKVKSEDSKEKSADETQTESNKPSTFSGIFNSLKLLLKYVFFDYDQINITFNQDNQHSSNGLKSTLAGFQNFWGFNQNPINGPSRFYMLGLSTDAGFRVPNANLTNRFSQKNTFSFSTSRPLFQNVKIDLNWKVSWGVSKSATIETDALGNVTIVGLNSTGNIDRTFLSFPPSLFLTVFKSGIKKVNELYDEDSANPNQSLSDAFIQGFESLPLFSKIPLLSEVAKFIPRPNWKLTWSGLEKVAFFKSFTERVSLNHAYTSNYREGWNISPEGDRQIQTQRIDYGFSPLIGMRFTFKKLWNGNLTGDIRYSTRTAFDLRVTTRNITETFSRDINVSASYSKKGFSLPLFGIDLKNDLEVSFSYTSGKNSTLVYEMDEFREEGKVLDGTTRTILEPRIKYVMSSKVTLSLFYKRTKIEPDGSAQIRPTTTNEAGLDVRILIQ